MYIDGPPEWVKVSELEDTDYINYTGVIEKERLSAIPSFTNVVREAWHTSPTVTFTVLCYYTQYAGALYAELAGEKGGRPVYFEPAGSVMQVAEKVEGYDKVILSYPWDRGEFY